MEPLDEYVHPRDIILYHLERSDHLEAIGEPTMLYLEGHITHEERKERTIEAIRIAQEWKEKIIKNCGHLSPRTL